MTKYVTRNNHKRFCFEEDWHKLANFQAVRPLTVEQEITRFTSAGKNLLKLRGLGVYDFEEAQPLDDTLEDVTRDPDFDLIDAAVVARDLVLKNQSALTDGTATQSQGEQSADSLKKESADSEQGNGARGESAPVSEEAKPLA